MLTHTSHYEVVNGATICGDHENRRQYYYLPLTPRLTTRPDASGREVPQIQIIRYAGTSGTGGFLNFDCDLGLSEERLEGIRDHVRQTRKLSEPPLLAPPPMVDGSVRLMLFGKESSAAGGKPPVVVPTAEPGGPRFVRKIDHAAKPSLQGDEQAAFSVWLDEEGITTLDTALRGEMSPIGIVYSLTYAALRPAYRVHVEADWSRVQEHLAEQTSVNSLVFSAQVDDIVDKLIEDRVISVEVDSFVAPGDGDETALLSKDDAVDELKDMVLTTFFEPSLEPIQESGSFVDGAKRVTQLLATAGVGSLFSYRNVDISRIDQKALNATFSERSAVLRTIYPQGHLSGLVRALDQGLDPSRFTISVNTDHPFFRPRTVRVISRADWDADQIASVNVALTYRGDTQNVVLDATAPEGTVSWPSVLEGGRMVRDVEVSYTVAFKPSAGQGRPSALRTLAPETIAGDAFEVFPRDLYEVMSVPINVVSFPWDRYPSIELDASYLDEANGIRQSLHRVLGPGQEGQDVWPLFLTDRAHREITYSLLFHGADDRDIESPSVTTSAGLIRIADPFPRRLELTIVAPAAMFATVERAYVDVGYHGAGVQKTASYEFGPDLPVSQSFGVELVDPANREVAFKVTLVFLDGHVVQVPPSVTTERRLLLRPDMKGRRSVRVRPEPVDFARRSVREVVVETLFEDTVAQPTLRFADRFTFHTPTDSARFEFDYVDSSRDAFRYRVIHKYINGISKPSTWQQSQAAELVVPVR